jgi:hypothetical protein
VAVLTVGGDDGVFGRQRLHHPDRDRFLAVLQMQEAADLRGTVEFGAFALKPSNANHLLQELQRMVAVDLERCLRCRRF